jgi:hypothetical protein
MRGSKLKLLIGSHLVFGSLFHRFHIWVLCDGKMAGPMPASILTSIYPGMNVLTYSCICEILPQDWRFKQISTIAVLETCNPQRSLNHRHPRHNFHFKCTTHAHKAFKLHQHISLVSPRSIGLGFANSSGVAMQP